jgi:hypothetical protein
VGEIYKVPVLRASNNQIIGFGSATPYSTAPYIDGGLAFGPDGTLFFTEWPVNKIGEILEPCSPLCSPAGTIDLAGLVASSVGTIGVVPSSPVREPRSLDLTAAVGGTRCYPRVAP